MKGAGNVTLGFRVSLSSRGFLNRKARDVGKLSGVRLAWPSPSDGSVATSPQAWRALTFSVESGLSSQVWSWCLPSLGRAGRASSPGQLSKNAAVCVLGLHSFK